MSQQKTHSKISASATHRWFYCPGSVRECEGIPPKEDTEFSLEGTLAHSLVEQVLSKPPANAFYYVGKEDQFNLRTAKMKELNLKVTEEMAKHAQEFVDNVRVLKNSLPGSELHIEKKFHLKHIHPDAYGTSDVVIVQPFGEIHVIDFKYGAGVPVEVQENTQLLYYGLGAIYGEDFSQVTLHIHQPRAPHNDGTWRSWTTTAAYMSEFAKLLKQKIVETTKKDAALVPGDQCRWCPAAARCPALHTKAMQTARADFAAPSPTLPQAERMTDEQIALVIENEKLVTTWIDAVRSYALARLMEGKKIKGLKLVKGRGRRVWGDEDRVRLQFGKKIIEESLMTPAQAEKILGKPAVAEFIVSVEGNLTLAHESDRRAAITSAKDDFKAVSDSMDIADF